MSEPARMQPPMGGTPAPGTCPEFGQGFFAAPLLCDRPFEHNGPHHCPTTGATWEALPWGGHMDGLPHTRLTDEQVRAIRAHYLRATGPTKRGGRSSNATQLAEKFGISRMYVWQIITRKYRADAP